MGSVKVNGMKLCPWCGSEGKVQFCGGKYSVVCSHTNWCAVVPWTWQYDTKEEAIAAWNTRKSEMHCNTGSIPNTFKVGEQE